MTCPACDGDTVLLPETHTEAGKMYTLHECSVCRFCFWMPFQNPGASWYEHDERYANRNNDPILTANTKQKMVADYVKDRPGRVLDVGCGVGNFLAYVRSKGWETWGIDFDHDAIAAGVATFNLTNLSVNDLGSFHATHPNLKFDLITFFDVFEHIDNHNEFMREAIALLKPDGRLALSVPYRSAWRWLVPADLPPRHLTRWDQDSLERFLRRHGFSIRTVHRLPASIYYIAMKLRYKYGTWSSIGLVRKAKAQAGVSKSKVPRVRIGALHLAAKVKDIALFGIPALVIWLALLVLPARYTDITLVADRRGNGV